MRKKAEIASVFAETEKLGAAERFFLVGIGGAGLSGLARMLAHRGHWVLGTDATASPVTDGLAGLGIGVQIGHSGATLRPGDAVVLSDAIDLETSPEVARARELGCPLFRRSQLLGWLLRGYDVVAVTGTHGKTTTTGMIGAGLIAAGVDPVVVVGAEVPEWGSAIREGSGRIAVVEACEAYDGFHDLTPKWVALTNLELDHVDFHETWEGLKGSVARFLGTVPEADGAVFYHESDRGSVDAVQAAGLGARGVAVDDRAEPAGLAMPGAHNRLNARLAMSVLEVLGLAEAGATGVARFGGAERRLQVVFDEPSLTFIDDYAHHPTEIEASLGALRERYSGRRLVVVYQPHLYSRTAPLIGEFAAALSGADFVVLTDIYPAREAPMPGVSSLRIAEQLKVPNRYVPSRHLLARSVMPWLRPGDVLVAMGAGNIAEFVPDFLAERARNQPGRALKVAVLCGGDSAEREVSLNSGRAVFAACERLGYEAELVDASETLLTGRGFQGWVGAGRPDVVLPMVHGTHAEDGAIQGLLDLLHVRYSGSGIAASAIGIDKQRTKEVLVGAGLPVPRGVRLRRGEGVPELRQLEGDRFVVKPSKQGSTVGLSFVEQRAELPGAIDRAFDYDDEVLVEEWVVGTEISVPVLGGAALPVVEIVPVSGRYDFESKYTPGATDEICPARLSEAVMRQVQEYAVQAHRALGCAGVTRTDMIVSEGRIVILEVNTLPGMTPTSLVPRAAQEAGMSFDQLVEALIRDALS